MKFYIKLATHLFHSFQYSYTIQCIHLVYIFRFLHSFPSVTKNLLHVYDMQYCKLLGHICKAFLTHFWRIYLYDLYFAMVLFGHLGTCVSLCGISCMIQTWSVLAIYFHKLVYPLWVTEAECNVPVKGGSKVQLLDCDQIVYCSWQPKIGH